MDEEVKGGLLSVIAARVRMRAPTSPTLSARLALGAVGFALLLAGCEAGKLGGQQKQSDSAAAGSDFGAFAGYARYGRLTEVQASWTVPRIVGGQGAAGTWIGAQAPGNPGPFIQIGTNEQRDTLPEKPEYYAFWSDKSQHFHGIELFRVRPGHRISASLKLVGVRWKLAIVDANSGDSSVFETSEEAKHSFNDAEWKQEDITDDKTGRPFPYPQLSPVSFHRLRANSRTPAYAHLVSSWLSADGYDLAPTPLSGDGFTIHAATVSATGTQYLRLAKGEDDATDSLESQASHWTAKTRRAAVIRTVEMFTRTLRINAKVLAQARWPAPIGRLVNELVSRLNAAREEFSAALRSSDPIPRLRTIQGLNRLGAVALRIRRALHIPENVP